MSPVNSLIPVKLRKQQPENTTLIRSFAIAAYGGMDETKAVYRSIPATLFQDAQDGDGLAESIQRYGQRTRVIVGPDDEIFAGFRIGAACHKAGLREVHVLEVPDRLAAIEIMLTKSEGFSVLERAELLVEAKQLYESKHPEVKKGGNQKEKSKLRKLNQTRPFSEHVEHITDKKQTQRRVQQLIEITKIPADDRAAIHTMSILRNDEDNLRALAKWQPITGVTRQMLANRLNENPRKTLQHCLLEIIQKQNQTLEPASDLLQGMPVLLHGYLQDVLARQEHIEKYDAIITDFPWGHEFLDELEAAINACYKALKPSGWFMTFFGTGRLNTLLRTCDHVFGEDSYWWTLLDDHGAGTQTARIQSKRLSAGVVPIVVYQKPPITARQYGEDLPCIFRSKGMCDKKYHAWQQPAATVEWLIEHFTNPGDLILDPCIGGGTTMVAALNTGRRIIGIDRDGAAITACKNRFAQWKTYMR